MWGKQNQTNEKVYNYESISFPFLKFIMTTILVVFVL